MGQGIPPPTNFIIFAHLTFTLVGASFYALSFYSVYTENRALLNAERMSQILHYSRVCLFTYFRYDLERQNEGLPAIEQFTPQHQLLEFRYTYFFLVAKLLYKLFVRLMSVCLSVRFREKRDFLGPYIR